MSTSLGMFTSNTSFTFGAGGAGVDFDLTRRFAWRGHWLHDGFSRRTKRTNEEVHNLVRLSTGIVIRF